MAPSLGKSEEQAQNNTIGGMTALAADVIKAAKRLNFCLTLHS